MLVNLLTLDIVPCKIHATSGGDSQEIDSSLSAEVTTHTSAPYYHSSYVSKKHKGHHNITDEMMHRDGFLEVQFQKALDLICNEMKHGLHVEYQE